MPSFIQLCKCAKNYVSKESTVNVTLPFKLLTNYTSVVLVLVSSIITGSDYFTENIDCTKVSQLYDTSYYDNEWANWYCFQHETFLVVKAFDPNIRNQIMYPGVSAYKRGIDELFWLNYYNKLWMLLATWSLISYIPYMFFKVYI